MYWVMNQLYTYLYWGSKPQRSSLIKSKYFNYRILSYNKDNNMHEVNNNTRWVLKESEKIYTVLYTKMMVLLKIGLN